MKQIKIKSMDGKSTIKVPEHKGYIVVNKRGFIPVQDHPMWIEQMNVEYLEMYYRLPQGIKLP